MFSEWFSDIAVSRDGEGQLLAQSGDRSHDRPLSNSGDFDSDRLRPPFFSAGKATDQSAFNDVFCLGKAEQVFDAAVEHRG